MADIKQNQTLVQEFILLIEQLPNDIISTALKFSNDEDEKAIINAFATPFSEQFKEISVHLTEISSKSSKQQLAEAEKFMKLSAGNTLVKNLKIALPSIGSIIGKLGIDGIVKEIKKIITKLLEIFHINLPGWVNDIVNLIDEILKDILGLGSSKVRTALSIEEQNYLKELTELAKLKKATRDLSIEDEED